MTIGLGLTKWYIWIPAILFSFNSGDLFSIFSNGRVQTTEDRTLHFKEGYVYENGRWYFGAATERLATNLVMTTHWRDSNNDPHNSTETHNYSQTSTNYYNNTNIRALALYWYNQFNGPYIENYPEATSRTIN